MYVHAVQSYIWNHMASERIRIYGTKIVKGDLVALPNPMSASQIGFIDEEANNLEPESGGTVEEARLGRMIEVKVIESEEEAEKCGLEDLVLPLPGYAIQYPTNDIGRLYGEFMAQYGLDPHDMKRKNR
jgi:tRNA pseudouridine13 synthase